MTATDVLGRDVFAETVGRDERPALALFFHQLTPGEQRRYADAAPSCLFNATYFRKRTRDDMPVFALYGPRRASEPAAAARRV